MTSTILPAALLCLFISLVSGIAGAALASLPAGFQPITAKRIVYNALH